MEAWYPFVWGTVGCAGIEVVVALNAVSAGRVPERYRHKLFWSLRAALCFFGGGAAIAFGASDAVPALCVGATPPALLLATARGA
jgi:hypothetical protein